ncbi:hypothetical protein WBJ53_32105 (plasmid) [Spirosoma sp. SC4-14]|uniref:hypothetical protein n=1 Tax=Spirosoma sp. SC4-14 TaxID=3128900 RepID=UPI0030D0A382
MHLQLMNGCFTKTEALELLAQLIAVKLNFHQQKIAGSHSEEDIKQRESRIKQLQNELAQARWQIESTPEPIDIHAIINL